MNTQANPSWYLGLASATRGVMPTLIVGLAVVLFSTAGVARMMGWGPNFSGDPGDITDVDRTAAAATVKAGARPRCPECATIVSMREIDGQDENACSAATGTVADNIQDGKPQRLTGGYEITVRMADGSSRVMNLASPARWRNGERLIVIGAMEPSN